MYLGIDNVMALRGDAMKGHQYFEPTQGGHASAMDLVNQINDLEEENIFITKNRFVMN
jgi:methylenetetrahydrofolate reductase (NADPH)